MEATILRLSVASSFDLTLGQLRTFELRGQPHVDCCLCRALNFGCLATSLMQLAKLQELVLECGVAVADISVLVIPCLGQMIGISGKVLAEIAFPQCCIALALIPYASRLHHVGMVLVVWDCHRTLCELDLKTLAENVLMTERFIGTLLDPAHKRSLLLHLSDGFIALVEGSLIRSCLGYKDATIPDTSCCSRSSIAAAC